MEWPWAVTSSWGGVRASALVEQAVSDAAALLPQSWLRLSQVFLGHQPISRTGCLFRNITLIDEHQIVSREVLQPLVPADRSEPGHAGEVEPYPGAAVLHIDCGRSRLRGLAGRRFRTAPCCPFANELGIVGRQDRTWLLGLGRVRVNVANRLVFRQQ